MKRSEKKSEFYGVSIDKSTGKFYARIVINGKANHLGSFNQEIDAVIAYDKFVRANELNRRLNFPDPEPENLIPNTRLIRLTQGKFAIVDEEDFEYLNQWNWHAQKCKNNYYAYRVEKINGKRRYFLMHREILNSNNPSIDHKNKNGLHNYRSNLRECSISQNAMNTKKRKGCLSIYKGILIHPHRKTIRSSIACNGIRYYLGVFENEIDAAKAYDAKAKELFGEFASLNFPEKQLQTT